MRPTSTSVRPAVLAAALLLGATTVAGAQTDTTRVPVTKSIPVTKSVPPRPDTVVTKVVTGEVAPTLDSAPTPAPTRVMPTTAPRIMETPRHSPYLFGGRGFYLGVAGGATQPISNFDNMGYRYGVHMSVPVGWQPRGHMLGVRALLSVDQARSASWNEFTADPNVYGGALDAIARLSMTGNDDVGLSMYLLGGAGVYQFRSFGRTGPIADALGDDTGKATMTKWGVDAGGGFEWRVGPAALFAESRWVNAFTNGTGTRANVSSLQWVPVLFGVTVR